jgi:hypothetical protein
VGLETGQDMGDPEEDPRQLLGTVDNVILQNVESSLEASSTGLAGLQHRYMCENRREGQPGHTCGGG